MKQQFAVHFRDNVEQWRSGAVSASERRSLYVKWLQFAVAEMELRCRHQIVDAHRRCGMGLLVDGSENVAIRIQGYVGKINV